MMKVGAIFRVTSRSRGNMQAVGGMDTEYSGSLENEYLQFGYRGKQSSANSSSLIDLSSREE